MRETYRPFGIAVRLEGREEEETEWYHKSAKGNREKKRGQISITSKRKERAPEYAYKITHLNRGPGGLTGGAGAGATRSTFSLLERSILTRSVKSFSTF